jgi:hypothetical protein
MMKRFEHDCPADMAVWSKLVRDVEISLHDFRFRKCQRIPSFASRERRRGVVQEDPAVLVNGKGNSLFVSRSTAIERHSTVADLVQALPKLCSNEKFRILPDSVVLGPDDIVAVKMNGRRAIGKILTIEDDMKSVMVHYKQFTEFDDQLLPLDQLRVHTGESLSEINTSYMKPGMAVVTLEGDNQYPAEIEFCSQCTCYLLLMLAPDMSSTKFHRWTTRHSIIAKLSNGNAEIQSVSSENGPIMSSRNSTTPVQSCKGSQEPGEYLLRMKNTIKCALAYFFWFLCQVLANLNDNSADPHAPNGGPEGSNAE